MNPTTILSILLGCLMLFPGCAGNARGAHYPEAIIGDWVLDEEATTALLRKMAVAMGEEATDDGIAFWLEWGNMFERCSFHADGTFKDHQLMSEFSVAPMPSAYVGEPIRIVNVNRWSIVSDRVWIEQLANPGRDEYKYPRFRIDGDRLISIFEDGGGTVTSFFVLKKVTP